MVLYISSYIEKAYLSLLGSYRRNIPGEERIAYTNAVQCLMNKPGQLSIFEGSK
jgi:hypothetical protein